MHLRVAKVAEHFFNRVVPCRAVRHDGRRQQDMRVRIFPTNRANPARVVAPPALRLFAATVLRHKVALGGVVLPNRDDDDMRREAAEIPRFFVVEERVIRQFVPAGQHPRIKEIAVAIL